MQNMLSSPKCKYFYLFFFLFTLLDGPTDKQTATLFNAYRQWLTHTHIYTYTHIHLFTYTLSFMQENIKLRVKVYNTIQYFLIFSKDDFIFKCQLSSIFFYSFFASLFYFFFCINLYAKEFKRLSCKLGA